MNAAAATQQMLDLFDITGIIHFGIAGNVNNSMSIGDVTIPKQFAHTGIWDWLVCIISSIKNHFNFLEYAIAIYSYSKSFSLTNVCNSYFI